MKEQIINEIVRTLHEMGIDTDGVTERLYLIFKDVEVSKAETALAVRDDMQNETLLRQFLAAKAVKGCTKNTIELVSKMLGHEQIATTQIYLDLSEHELEEAHKKYVI